MIITDDQIDKWFVENYPHSIKFTRAQARQMLSEFIIQIVADFSKAADQRCNHMHPSCPHFTEQEQREYDAQNA